MDLKQFETRKKEHILHSLDGAHQASGHSGLDQIHLFHDALPELGFSEISLDSHCLGKATRTPFYVAGMTAGHEDAPALNRTLALACQKRGWAMGVGSQRRDLEGNGVMDHWRKLRDEVPDLVLFANIGLSQLIGAQVPQIRKIVKDLGAQALAVHANALQETMQPEGTPLFRGGLKVLKKYCEELEVPVILKETGCGFSQGTLEKISSLDLAAVDVSGLGGTHWGRIEGARADKKSVQAAASQTFANWGESTVDSVLAAVKVLQGGAEIWASGGVRSGLDAAKLIALGANRLGYAKPALEAALKGSDELDLWMEIQEYELKVALLCTGSANCQALRRKEGIWKIKGI